MRVVHEKEDFGIIKTLALSLALGIFIGIFAGLIIPKIFFLFPFFREEMPIETMVLIFLSNSFLATLICYGGVLFSLAETKVYSFSFYRFFDKAFDPLYSFLSRFSKKIEKLKPMYRSCYFSLFYFPLGCIFLFSFLISSFFSIFLNILGFSVFPRLIKIFPHILLETFCFSFSAFQGLKIKNKLEKYLFERKLVRFKKEARKILKERRIKKKLLVIYAILLISALVEKLGF
jgi:uncharacterized protein YacL